MCRSLTSLFGKEPSIEYEGRYPEGAPSYNVAVACRFEASDQTTVDAAVQRVERTMLSAEKLQVSRWLATLSIATRGPHTGEADALLSHEIYAGVLLKYPADVAKAACTALACRPPRGTTNWFPSLGELTAECDRLAGPRRALLAGLRSWKPKTDQETRAEQRREWLFLESKARREALDCRRSDPDRHSALIEFADHAMEEARKLFPPGRA